LVMLKIQEQFLQFGQNTGIGTHFTNGLHGLAKEISRSLLEKVRCLFSNARLDNSFRLRRLYMLTNS